jgi:hypothetical protein
VAQNGHFHKWRVYQDIRDSIVILATLAQAGHELANLPLSVHRGIAGQWRAQEHERHSGDAIAMANTSTVWRQPKCAMPHVPRYSWRKLNKT